MFDDFNLELLDLSDGVYKIADYNFDDIDYDVPWPWHRRYPRDIDQQNFFVYLRDTDDSDQSLDDLYRSEKLHQLSEFRSGVYVLANSDSVQSGESNIFIGMLQNNESLSLTDCLLSQYISPPESAQDWDMALVIPWKGNVNLLTELLYLIFNNSVKFKANKNINKKTFSSVLEKRELTDKHFVQLLVPNIGTGLSFDDANYIARSLLAIIKQIPFDQIPFNQILDIMKTVSSIGRIISYISKIVEKLKEKSKSRKNQKKANETIIIFVPVANGYSTYFPIFLPIHYGLFYDEIEYEMKHNPRIAKFFIDMYANNLDANFQQKPNFVKIKIDTQ